RRAGDARSVRWSPGAAAERSRRTKAAGWPAEAIGAPVTPGASAGVQEQLQESGRTKAAGWPG
ncbi:hypothetical protein, partial [Paenibacillus sp. 1A_MP2]|uniref:hypothetical protein n=1 Tax=Paenibacillus sp. 1A_MP2 TaxID=3457495 RepID=UPI003FCDB966